MNLFDYVNDDSSVFQEDTPPSDQCSLDLNVVTVDRRYLCSVIHFICLSLFLFRTRELKILVIIGAIASSDTSPFPLPEFWSCFFLSNKIHLNGSLSMLHISAKVIKFNAKTAHVVWDPLLLTALVSPNDIHIIYLRKSFNNLSGAGI